MDKTFEINKNGQNVRCKLYFNKGERIEKVVLYGHGFAGHKDNSSAKNFAERVLSKYKGWAILTFDLPCHGTDVKKRLSLADCDTYLSLVLDYIKGEMQVESVFSYAISFGGYLVLKYIHEHGNPFEKILLRCPAVNMAEVLKNTIIQKGGLELLQKGKPIVAGFDRKIEMTSAFLEDLEANDVQTYDFLNDCEQMVILHGTKDEVVPYEKSQSFADNNLIEFISVENADHRFQNPAHMEIVTKKAIEFFGF